MASSTVALVLLAVTLALVASVASADKRPERFNANAGNRVDRPLKRGDPCPVKAGDIRGREYVKDPHYCDRFHSCANGRVTRVYRCADGLVFHGRGCSLPYGQDCAGRSRLQEPRPSGHCQRQYGHFEIKGSCTSYVICSNGKAQKLDCPALSVFDIARGVCVLPAETTRTECGAEKAFKFTCPKDVGFRLHADPKDCRAFYSCAYPSFQPHLGGCGEFTVFNPNTQRCDDPKHVPGCEDYYAKEQVHFNDRHQL